jgi:hypothetical protein
MDPRELRKFAAECLQLAATASDPERAVQLRTMAREMLDLAGGSSGSTQQQQQIQPQKTEPDSS